MLLLIFNDLLFFQIKNIISNYLKNNSQKKNNMNIKIIENL